MPEGVALATTKRKFYRALDNLTSSQVSLAPSTTESVTTAKRPATAAAAFDEARERAAKRLRYSTSSSSLPYTLASSPTTSKKVGTKAKEPPNFAPWSHESFLARLKTFSSVSLWHPKPEAISEVEWAKRGWACVDVNTVGCKGGCERRVVVSLDMSKKGVIDGDSDEESNDEEETAFEKALAERYKDEIIDGHSETCLWKKQGCKDEIYRVQVVRPSVWQPELSKRYQSALAIRAAIQDVRMKTLERDPKLLVLSVLLKDLSGDILGGSDSIQDFDASSSALEIALHGWRGSKEAGSELLHCDACFQRIGLWMYQPGYRPSNPDSDDEDASGPATVDLIEMHREHCPWRNSVTQAASGSLKGLNACEILQRVVSTYARDQRRRSDEQRAVENGHLEQQDEDGDVLETANHAPPAMSKEEVALQDKERESRIRKLKRLFTIKRRPKAGTK